MEFSDNESLIDGVLVVRITGEIDLGSSVRLGRRLQSIVERADRVVIDLTDVTFFDSSGLKTLDDAQQLSRAKGSALSLVCPPGRTLTVFDITGLRDHFSIHDSVDSAVGSSAPDA